MLPPRRCMVAQVRTPDANASYVQTSPNLMLAAVFNQEERKTVLTAQVW